MGLKDQILDIRDSGEVNMLDSHAVQVMASQRRYYSLVVFIEDHRREYCKFIMTGNEELLTC